jgi:electron transfer flavoprotein alpha subunit
MEGSLSPRIQVLTVGAEGEWSPHSLELLGDAAALARRMSGAVDAWVLPPTPPGGRIDELARHGADSVTLLLHERLERWASEAVAAALAQTLLPACRLILLPADARGEEVAGLLAGRLDTEWIPDAITLGATRAGQVEITAALPGGRLSRAFRAEAERPIVVTMREGVAEARAQTAATAPALREITPDLSDVAPLTATGKFLPADPRTQEIVHARRIVAGGRGTGGSEGMKLVAELTDALHASLAASRVAVDLGWAPPERQVGQTGKTVKPDLYVACGISGASHHLAGMRESRHIVAINPDAAAPIHEVAHLSLRADLRELIPAIQSVLGRRTQRVGE